MATVSIEATLMSPIRNQSSVPAFHVSLLVSGFSGFRCHASLVPRTVIIMSVRNGWYLPLEWVAIVYNITISCNWFIYYDYFTSCAVIITEVL